MIIIFYSNFIPVVCKDRPLLVSFLCIHALPDDGWSGELNHHHHHHHHHHMSVMELGHLLTHSGPTYPEASSFCQLGNRVSLPWVICYEALCLHVVSSSFCIPVICPELVLFLIHLQFVYLFCNLSKCILLFFSYISSLLLLFSWHPLL